MSKRILVIGATGQQGGAVVKSLTGKGYELFGITRNINSDKSKELFQMGVKMLECDISDLKTLKDIMSGLDVVYFVTTPFEKGVDYEFHQGEIIAQIAKESKVEHVVFSSVANADKKTGIPHFDSKYKIEQEIIRLGLNYTIIAPVYFMDNLTSPWSLPSLKDENKITSPLLGDKLLQQISVDNIGDVVAEVIDRGKDAYSKRIDIAGDEISGNEMAKKLTDYLKRTISYESFDIKYMMEDQLDMALMFKWFINVGYDVNIDNLKKEFPNIHWDNFPEWLQNQKII